ncbi:MAG: hypothetical protein M9935_01070 [Kiritimatiellae bacterium]|nr:hypothetical protein [Kiritimatiellia bacterium]
MNNCHGILAVAASALFFVAWIVSFALHTVAFCRHRKPSVVSDPMLNPIDAMRFVTKPEVFLNQSGVRLERLSRKILWIAGGICFPLIGLSICAE